MDGGWRYPSNRTDLWSVSMCDVALYCLFNCSVTGKKKHTHKKPLQASILGPVQMPYHFMSEKKKKKKTHFSSNKKWMVVVSFLYLNICVCVYCWRQTDTSWGHPTVVSFTSTLYLLLLLLGRWLTSDPPVMIPCREDDDCTDCAVWSVAGQNIFKEALCLLTSHLSVSAPSIYLRFYRCESASLLSD